MALRSEIRFGNYALSDCIYSFIISKKIGINTTLRAQHTAILYFEIHQFEPLLPEQDINLVDLAEQLIAADAKLSGGLHVLTKVAIADLVRSMNCFYSNLI